MNFGRLGVLCLMAALAHAQPKPAERSLSTEEKLALHIKRMTAPASLVASAASAGISQLEDHPEEWGQGAAGYGRRYASSVGFRGARNLIAFGIDSTLRQDPRYFQS